MKPIRTDADHAAALVEIAGLIDAKPGTADADRLEVLGVLVADYERRGLAEPADPADVLAVAMQMQGRSQADLASVLGSRARASEVLSRHRGLSSDMVERLATAWDLPKSLLAGGKPVRKAAPAVRAVSIVAGLIMLGAGVTAGVFGWAARGLPDIAPLVAQAKADDSLTHMPSYAVQAFVASQDQRFLAHTGYDPRAMVRAVAHNIVHGRSRLEGGSTLTQQVVKTGLLAGEPRSLRRELREVILARRLEAALSKDQITALYLDHVYLGGGAYGVAQAAYHYFGRDPADLTVAQAAYLAALPDAPDATRLDKSGNDGRALQGRNRVLDRMARQGFLTVAARDSAVNEALR